MENRAAAARYIVENRLDGKGANDLARAMKDFPRRKGDKGWDSFEYDVPGDCLAFMYYRLSREHNNSVEARTAALEEALKVAETKAARNLILRDLEKIGDGKGGIEEEIEVVKVPVVRLNFGEVAEATRVVVLPVSKASEGENGLREAPMEVKTEGQFEVLVAAEGWRRWVVLPGWDPLTGLGNGGVVVSFEDARVLPWRVNRWYKEEPILVVADRSRKEVESKDEIYLIRNTVGGGDDGGKGGGGGDLKVLRGDALMDMGVKECLGIVLLVVRPPKDMNDDVVNDEDWD